MFETLPVLYVRIPISVLAGGEHYLIDPSTRPGHFLYLHRIEYKVTSEPSRESQGNHLPKHIKSWFPRTVDNDQLIIIKLLNENFEVRLITREHNIASRERFPTICVGIMHVHATHIPSCQWCTIFLFLR